MAQLLTVSAVTLTSADDAMRSAGCPTMMDETDNEVCPSFSAGFPLISGYLEPKCESWIWLDAQGVEVCPNIVIGNPNQDNCINVTWPVDQSAGNQTTLDNTFFTASAGGVASPSCGDTLIGQIANTNNTTPGYTLGGTDASKFKIVANSGWMPSPVRNAPYLVETNGNQGGQANGYSITITPSDGVATAFRLLTAGWASKRAPDRVRAARWRLLLIPSLPAQSEAMVAGR